MTVNIHAARIGELAAELNMAIRNAAKDGYETKASITMVGARFSRRTPRIPRVNVEVIRKDD